MHALRHALSLVSLVFEEALFGRNASLHDLFLHYLAKCFFCNLFWGIFWEVVTNVYVYDHGRWNVFEDGACNICFDLYSSQYQEGLRLHVHGEGFFVRVSYVTGM